jgi:hypothetical protein
MVSSYSTPIYSYITIINPYNKMLIINSFLMLFVLTNQRFNYSMAIPGSQIGGTLPYKAIFCGDIP